MDITLYTTTSDRKALTKTLTNTNTVSGLVKQDSRLGWKSITLLISGDFSTFAWNYLALTAGGRTRYYFIQNMTVQRNSLIEITAEEDVLMTFKTEIMNARGLVIRSGNLGNMYYDDGTLKTLASRNTTVKIFPSGFNDNPTYILVAAEGGTAVSTSTT